jgi:hypothetical protein
MQFQGTLNPGPNREVTREGFTLFRNVSVSRTGWQVYGGQELPGIEPGPDGLIHIYRAPEEVFRPETLASCNGKSLVIEHPDDDVQPHNWRELTNGIMFDARRGAGEQKDECVTDILVTTPEAMAEIDNGVRQLSLGYDADYFVLGPGRGEQRNIIVNHLALVENGRCGAGCAIRDHAPRRSSMERFMDGVKTKYRAQAPTADQLARMTSTERFSALSQARRNKL